MQSYQSTQNPNQPVNNWQWPEYVVNQAPTILQDEMFFVVSIQEQKLYVCQNKVGQLQVLSSYVVSTAKAGVGNLNGSGQTPLGWHQVKLKIGQGCPENCVFIGRRPTGEVFSNALASKQPNRDWILTRILWLSGLQKGFNRRQKKQGDCDTLRRFIYFHGTPDNPKEPLGQPYSHGCIRMKNKDLIQVFNAACNQAKVLIIEPEFCQLTTQIRLQGKK